jgi:Ca2+-binding RTX toxin-like protein
MGDSTYSNGYIWNADVVLRKVIDERSQTQVVFMNGILTPQSSFNNGQSANSAFNLTGTVNSIQFKPQYNPTSVPTGPGTVEWWNSNRGGMNLAPGLEDVFRDFHQQLSPILFQPAIDKWNRDVDFLSLEWLTNIEAKNTVEKVARDQYYLRRLTPYSYSDNTFDSPYTVQKVVSFLEKYGDLENLQGRLEQKFSTNSNVENPPNDLLEAFSQYWSDNPSKASLSVNNQWIPDTTKFLEKSNKENSLIIVSHSQANYFIEDALRDSRFNNLDSSKIKIISLGSPTNYTSQGLDKYKLSLYNPKEQSLDPVTKLQFNSGASESDKLGQFLSELTNIMSVPGKDGLRDKHDLNKYLNLLEVQKDFRNSFFELNPRGYYFPEGVINGSDPNRNGEFSAGEGTNRGDWLEGIDNYNDTLNPKGGNDVVRGKSGDDRVIAGAGWDFIDGGTGIDFADYGAWEHPVTVHADSILLGGEVIYPNNYSDTYKVTKDTYGTQDILVDIEEIYGSRFSDKMYGGRGKDVFHGNAGNDELWGEGYSGDFSDMQDTDEVSGSGDILHGGAGDDTLRGQGGNDELHGNSDQDILLGGVGDDLLYGGSGNDLLIGGQGYDTIDGSSDIDTVSYWNSPGNVVVNIDEINPYLSNISYRENIAVNSANPSEYFYELEPDFQIGAGKAIDGFLSTDKLKNLRDIIASPNNDILIGNEKNNDIKALAGNDVIISTAGYDSFNGGAGNDTVSYRRDPGNVEVNLANNVATDGWGNKDWVTNIENIVGSDNGNDNLIGNGSTNIITGGNGNDIIDGGAGDDRLYGEFGNDTIIGGLGRDYIVGNQGTDVIWGDIEGNTDVGDSDYIRGGDGDDDIRAGGGDDLIFGDSGIGNDKIRGDAGNDELHGGAGNDIIEGGTENDLILGEYGADILRGNSGSDTIDGGEGIDLVDYGDAPSGVIVNINESQGYSSTQENSFAPYLSYEIGAGAAKDGYGFSDTLRNLEDIDGSEFADVLIGNNVNNKIQGRGGSDLLVGLTGDDDLQGQDGDDVMVGGAGKDRLNGGTGIDIASYIDATSGVAVSLYAKNGWQGDAVGDEILATEGLEGSKFNDYLIGDNDKNILRGLAGDDTLEGYGGDDEINGGDGNDRLVGGLGNDTQIGGWGNDTHYAELGNDTITDLTGDNHIDAGEGNNVVTAGDGNDIVYSGPNDDVISGGNGSNRLYAGEGKNQITAGSENDIIYAGASDDLIKAGAGDDQIYAAEGNNSIYAGLGNDLIYAGAGNDFILGGAGNDLIYAGDGDNLINGGVGNDIIYSGSGKDVFALRIGDGTDTIHNFQVGKDLIGLSDGLSFDDLSITQGIGSNNEFLTLISDANNGDVLASLNWVQANDINSSSFTII